MIPIDTQFNFLTETPPGKDADAVSPTLKRYHRLLWTKPLPSGPRFALRQREGAYLVYEAEDRTIYPASDAITTNLHGKAARVLTEISPERLPPDLGYTIGSSILFPGEKVGRQMTINGARGFHPRIADRFDLTLECIRRHYAREASPLSEVLERYSYFFELFVDFARYVEFWLLEDLLGPGGEIRFFHTFEDFRSPAVPRTVEDYLDYVHVSNAFIASRNRRIQDYAAH